MWATLMTDLGYERFAASGGDIGTHVVRYLALDHPDRVVAAHRIDGGLAWPGIDTSSLSPAERAFVQETDRWRTAEGAYAMMHRTKPQTAAVGLTDSPAASPRGSSRSSGRGATAAVTSGRSARATRSWRC